MNACKQPVVPNELTHLITPSLLEVHQEWSSVSKSKLRELSPIPEAFDIGERIVRAVVIDGDPEAGIDVIGFPHQQSWKPSTAIRTLFHHAANNQNGVTIALPHGSVSDRYYHLSEAERNEVNSGNMQSLYWIESRTIEAVLSERGYAGKIRIKGYSLGGLVALGIASEPSDLEIASIHSIEAPVIEREPKQLRKDFIESGGPREQLAAIEDSGLPICSKSLRIDRLALDYLRFGIASFTNKDNKAIGNGMARPGAELLLEKALYNHTEMTAYFGRVAGSLLFSRDALGVTANNNRINFETYYGEGSHGHATGDNPVALALMFSR